MKIPTVKHEYLDICVTLTEERRYRVLQRMSPFSAFWTSDPLTEAVARQLIVNTAPVPRATLIA